MRDAASRPVSSGVGIVVLNWRRWPDTVACLKSLVGIEYSSYSIVVVDNGSGDESVDSIAQWCKSQKGQREFDFRVVEAKHSASASLRLGEIVLLKSNTNLGYAGGNNLGLACVFASEEFAYAWVLNNDTEATTESLAFLVERVFAAPEIGLCGSSLFYFDEKEKLQAAGGGRYTPWLAVSREYQPAPDLLVQHQTSIEERLDYIAGASTLITRSFWRDVGPMTEDYFLYFEELDWVARAKGKYKLGYAAKSIVYHKEGASIGTSARRPESRSMLSEFYGTRNRLLFTGRHHPFCLPSVYSAIVLGAMKRFARGDWRRGAMSLELLLTWWRLPRFKGGHS